MGDDDTIGVVEGGEALSGSGVSEAELFVGFALIGWARDELIVFGEKTKGAPGLGDGASGFAVFLGEGDWRGAALGNVEAFASG